MSLQTMATKDVIFLNYENVANVLKYDIPVVTKTTEQIEKNKNVAELTQ